MCYDFCQHHGREAEMATLQMYLEAAKSAILAGAYDRAILICLHTLAHFPKHVEGHCLLGEAYREKGYLDKAQTIFLRVLSADPENLVARWALSVISEERGEREEALRQIRLAFDVNPWHGEVRKEVTRLSGSKPRLSRAGLGRLYLRQGLTGRAIEEFRSILLREPGRLDVQVALAEALCRVGLWEEAASLCRDILEDSPDCLKACLILGHLYLAQNGATSAAGEELLSRAEALDPENGVAVRLFSQLGWSSPLTARSVAIPPMDGEEENLVLDRTLAEEVCRAPLVEDSAEQTAQPAASPAVAEGGEPTIDAAAPVEMAIEATSAEELAAFEQELGADASPEQSAIALEEIGEGLATEASVAAAGEVETEGERTWLDAYLTPGEPELPVAPALEAATAVGGEAGEMDSSQLVAAYGEEWASLLTEEIRLDAESEARLEAALADAKMSEARLAEGLEQVTSGEATRGEYEPKRESQAAVQTGGDGVAEGDQSNYQKLLREAVGHQEAGLVELAIEEYRTLLKSAPELAEEISHHLKVLLQSRPEQVKAHRVLGDAYMKLGRFQLAIEEYNWVLSKGKEKK